MKIEEYISELLYDHDCVIVPGFGGFVCNYAPAQVDPLKHLFEPPGKKILFNKGLTRNDGLLAHHISGKLKLPYSHVLDSIEKEVKSYREYLAKEKRITLENIGLLYLDDKENLLFQQDNKLNYLPQSFGLSSFYHLPVIQKTSGKGNPVIPIYKERSRIRVYAAAAVIGALAIGVSWVTLIDKSADIRFSSLNFFSNKETSLYSFSSAGYKELPKPLYEAFNVAAVGAIHESPLPSYSIIAGCFREKEHAENLISQFEKQNIHLSIIGKNPAGLYMVGYGKFLSHNGAAAERDKFRKNYVNDAWINQLRITN